MADFLLSMITHRTCILHCILNSDYFLKHEEKGQAYTEMHKISIFYKIIILIAFIYRQKLLQDLYESFILLLWCGWMFCLSFSYNQYRIPNIKRYKPEKHQPYFFFKTETKMLTNKCSALLHCTEINGQ